MISFWWPHARRAVAAVLVALALFTHQPAEAAERRRIERAAAHLLDHQLPSGFFRYDFDLLTGSPSGQDQITRQTGTVAVLAEYLLHTGDARARAVVERGLTTFEQLSVPIGKRPIQRALESAGLFSLPFGRISAQAVFGRLGLLYHERGDGRLVSASGKYGDALAGATALALVSELHYHRATGSGRFQHARQSWVKGLLSLLVAGSGFRRSPESLDQSPFYDGEGWLALAYYILAVPDDAEARATLSALDGYVMRRYANDVTGRFYQWGTMAAALRFQVTGDDRFVRFVAAQAEGLLRSDLLERRKDLNTCAALEGLATADMLLADRPAHAAVHRELTRRAEKELAKNMRLQVLVDDDRLQLGPDTYVVSTKLRELDGAFLDEPTRPYTRIDFTGHCLSAMLKRAGLRRDRLRVARLARDGSTSTVVDVDRIRVAR